MGRIKKEERTTIGVSHDTLRRFRAFMAEQVGASGRFLTHDDAVNLLLDCEGANV